MKNYKNIFIKIINQIDEKQKVKEICDYAAYSCDKLIIVGMKNTGNTEEYRILSTYNDEKDIIWNLEAAKLSILRQFKN